MGPILLEKSFILMKNHMKPARGPQTEFFSNSCSGIPGLANYEMLNEVCEGNFWGTFFRYRVSRSAAWTPFTGTGGLREPPVPRGSLGT